MANTCRISFISIIVLLLFTNHLALSSSARLRFIEGQDLVHGKQNNLLKFDEIEKADKARLDYLFGMIDDEAETNSAEEVDCSLPPCCSKPLYVD
ncbi:hypothetical protein BRARA_F02567 [Brassica rapa]|uniref:Uncharacterized protein n=1 Tax=Brassica campestris TaxID=3711 RepID=M4CZL4_BRACM|nr:uncharacterized protein LOC117126175 [Brassica rapa]RID59332.1 hypothetical protein BRARA_F02567 [Brassica rapa]